MTKVQVQIELSHTANRRQQLTVDGRTHDWSLCVRGVDQTDISKFVEKVVFKLHESFKNPKRSIKSPPFVVKESGWGSFIMRIDLYFKSREEPRKTSFQYYLALPGPNDHGATSKRVERITFTNPSQDFKEKLEAGGGTISTLVNSSDSSDNYSSSDEEASPTRGSDSKPTTDQPKEPARTQEPVVNDTFTSLFGEPIKPQAVKQANERVSSPHVRTDRIKSPSKHKTSSDKRDSDTKHSSHRSDESERRHKSNESSKKSSSSHDSSKASRDHKYKKHSSSADKERRGSSDQKAKSAETNDTHNKSSSERKKDKHREHSRSKHGEKEDNRDRSSHKDEHDRHRIKERPKSKEIDSSRERHAVDKSKSLQKDDARLHSNPRPSSHEKDKPPDGRLEKHKKRSHDKDRVADSDRKKHRSGSIKLDSTKPTFSPMRETVKTPTSPGVNKLLDIHQAKERISPSRHGDSKHDREKIPKKSAQEMSSDKVKSSKHRKLSHKSDISSPITDKKPEFSESKYNKHSSEEHKVNKHLQVKHPDSPASRKSPSVAIQSSVPSPDPRRSLKKSPAKSPSRRKLVKPALTSDDSLGSPLLSSSSDSDSSVGFSSPPKSKQSDVKKSRAVPPQQKKKSPGSEKKTKMPKPPKSALQGRKRPTDEVGSSPLQKIAKVAPFKQHESNTITTPTTDSKVLKGDLCLSSSSESMPSDGPSSRESSPIRQHSTDHSPSKSNPINASTSPKRSSSKAHTQSPSRSNSASKRSPVKRSPVRNGSAMFNGHQDSIVKQIIDCIAKCKDIDLLRKVVLTVHKGGDEYTLKEDIFNFDVACLSDNVLEELRKLLCIAKSPS